MRGKTTDINDSKHFSRTKNTTKSGNIIPANLSVVPKLAQVCEFQELVDEWLEACRADGLALKTRQDYTEKVAKFRWWWVEHLKKPFHPKHVTTKDARAFAAYLREPLAFRWGLPVVKDKQTLAPSSVQAYGRAFKVFFNMISLLLDSGDAAR
jgi:hypothetical protein